MAQLDSDMRDTQYQLEQAEDDIAVGIDEFKERLRAMYIAGNDSYSEVLINADNFYDVLMRVEFVKRVAAHDNEVIDDLLEQKAKIEKYKAELDEQSAALKEKSADYASKQADLCETAERAAGYAEGIRRFYRGAERRPFGLPVAG